MASIGGSATSNPNGGQDVNVSLIGQAPNLTAGVFAARNTLKEPTTTGAFAEAHANGHGLSVAHTTVHGVSSTLSENARLNLFKNDQHAIDANAFHSRTHMNDGLKFDRVGGNLAWQHAHGHAASVGVTKIPQFNMTSVDAAAKANLWASPNGANTLDLTGQASRSISGPFKGQNNFGAGLGFTHRF